MRILHVITSLRTGGAEKLMVDLLPRLAAQGHEVELCAFDGVRTAFYEQLTAKGIRIHYFHIGGSVYNPLNIIRLYRLMRKGWDIVHTHNTAPQLFAAICSLVCSKTTLVTTEHNTQNRRRAWAWYRAIDRWMYSRYRRVICISDQAEANYRQHLGSNHCKNVCTIYNGIDYQRYAQAKPATDVRSLGAKIITCVAGFRPQKDQPTLIRALHHLPEEYVVCLVGDGERRTEIEHIINAEGLQKRVHLLGLRTDVPEVLAASDYVVMSSHYEGLSLSSLEGMASGRPFIASDVDGLREVVKGCGILFAHEDARSLADTILSLDADNTLRHDVAARCTTRAKQYDICVMAERYAEVYEQLT